MFSIVLWYADRSNIQHAWGPYSNIEHAQSVMDELKTWPMSGEWEILPITPYRANWTTKP